MVDNLDYLVSAPLLYCSTKNHPALLRTKTIAWFLSPRFSIFLATSANHHFMLRIDLHERLKRSARRHFDSLSLLKVESTVCFQRKRRRERAVTRERRPAM